MTQSLVIAPPATLLTIHATATSPAISIATTPELITLNLGPRGPQGPVGPIGPQGTPGVSYTHTQASPSSTWTIPHNLGFRPTVTLLTTGGMPFLADIVHLTDNTLQVYTLAPIAGTARLT